MCPYFLTYGMTYEQYWKGDTMAARAYAQKYDLDRDNDNTRLWWQGLYNYPAHSVVLANAFSKKGAAKAKYLEEPIRLRPKTEAEKEAERNREIEKAYRSFDRLRAAQQAQREQHNGDKD